MPSNSFHFLFTQRVLCELVGEKRPIFHPANAHDSPGFFPFTPEQKRSFSRVIARFLLWCFFILSAFCGVSPFLLIGHPYFPLWVRGGWKGDGGAAWWTGVMISVMAACSGGEASCPPTAKVPRDRQGTTGEGRRPAEDQNHLWCQLSHRNLCPAARSLGPHLSSKWISPFVIISPLPVQLAGAAVEVSLALCSN